MNLFLTASINSIKYRGSVYENVPVSTLKVATMRKSNMAWYPDNVGKPAIHFEGTDLDAKWAYNTENERDADYVRLLGVKVHPEGGVGK